MGVSPALWNTLNQEPVMCKHNVFLYYFTPDRLCQTKVEMNVSAAVMITLSFTYCLFWPRLRKELRVNHKP